ncbi:MAG: cysteine synthase family protein [bacterium]
MENLQNTESSATSFQNTSALKTNGIIAAIGNTPLIQLQTIAPDLPPDVTIYLKAEHLNPSGSVKDRAARAMILDGIKTGKLTQGRTILDATSGNTGIAYAMIGSALGIKVALCMPKNASPERKSILRAYNAQLFETDPLLSSDGAMIYARELAEQHPDLYFYPDQYNNEANWKSHYDTTAVEIWQQTKGLVTHFVAGMGTSGTFIGTSRRLKDFNPTIQTIAMQPDSPMHGLEGMKHMDSTIHPGIYDPSVASSGIEVSTEEAYATTLLLARKEGLFVGISSGANVAAAIKIARTLAPGSVLVTILCDNGNRYLGDEVWSNYTI